MSAIVNANLPAFVEWETFPFTGDLRVKAVDATITTEPPREGDPGGKRCYPCVRPNAEYLWTDARWRLCTLREPSGLPFVGLLEPREHLDLDDLDDDCAADLGVALSRINRAIAQLPTVGRVHLNRFGDGRAHLHWWFLARPKGVNQLKGNFSFMWDQILPPLQRAEWRENQRQVAQNLVAWRGSSPVTGST
jgi:diadenosine tetraphosphate (Ap4A) HIT family hydrolase